MSRQATTAVEQAFHQRMHAAHIYGLWELASQMTRHPEPMAICLGGREEPRGLASENELYITYGLPVDGGGVSP